MLPLAFVLACCATLLLLPPAASPFPSVDAVRGAAGSPHAAAEDRQQWTVPLPAGRSLSVAITVGDVRISGESRADALIELRRTAPTAAGLARIPASLTQDDMEVALTALQIEEGTDPAFRTDVTLRVPRDAALRSMQILEGALTLDDFSGQITAEVLRGPITAANVAGTIRLTTEIGDVVLNGARAVAGGLLRLRTFNGDVRLTFAERPEHARILALALNGTIASAIPLTMKETWGPRAGEATLGRGEPVVSIDVVTGKIEIR